MKKKVQTSTKINKQAIDYHKQEPKGKILVIPSKPVDTDDELSLAIAQVWQPLASISLKNQTQCMTTQ